jgi:hypothetical protein
MRSVEKEKQQRRKDRVYEEIFGIFISVAFKLWIFGYEFCFKILTWHLTFNIIVHGVITSYLRSVAREHLLSETKKISNMTSNMIWFYKNSVYYHSTSSVPFFLQSQFSYLRPFRVTLILQLSVSTHEKRKNWKLMSIIGFWSVVTLLYFDKFTIAAGMKSKPAATLFLFAQRCYIDYGF